MPRAKLLVVFILLNVLCITGVAGYMVIEDWNFLDSAFMTAISLTTVGYAVVHPLSASGKVFTIILIMSGVGLFFYALTLLSEALIEGHLRGYFEKKKMHKKISSLSSHYILCGHGRLGHTIAENFSARGLPLVVIEKDPEIIKGLQAKKLMFIQGDATNDDVLEEAGVKRAKSIICTLNSDAANVYVVLTARSMNRDIFILTRASDMSAEKRMVQAGADKVITPYEIGAKRMVLAVLSPTVTEFLDLATETCGMDLSIEQITIQTGSELDGVTLKGIGLRERTGVNVLGIRRKDTGLSVELGPDEKILAGDIIVAMGTRKGLEKVKKLAGM